MVVVKTFSRLAVAGFFCSFLCCYGMQMPGQPPDDRRGGGDSSSVSSLEWFLNAGKRAAEGLSLEKRNSTVGTVEDGEMIDGHRYNLKRVVREFNEHKAVVASNADIIFSFLDGRRVKLTPLIGNFEKLGVSKSLIQRYKEAQQSSSDLASAEESSLKEESSQRGSDELASSVADDASEQPVAKKGKLSRGREGKKPKK